MWKQIGEDEAIALHNLPYPYRDWLIEHGAGTGERMELAPLAAGIDRGGEIIQEGRVEGTTGEPRG